MIRHPSVPAVVHCVILYCTVLYCTVLKLLSCVKRVSLFKGFSAVYLDFGNWPEPTAPRGEKRNLPMPESSLMNFHALCDNAEVYRWTSRRILVSNKYVSSVCMFFFLSPPPQQQQQAIKQTDFTDVMYCFVTVHHSRAIFK